MSDRAPLQYHTIGDSHVLRPVLWLVLLIAVPGLFDSVVKLWFFSWNLLTSKDMKQAWDELSRLHADQVLMILQIGRIPLATLVIVRAAGGLAGRGLRPLRQACFMLAFIMLAITIVRVSAEWAFVDTRSLRFERHLQITLMRAAPDIEAALLPAAAYLLLRRLTQPASAVLM